MVRRNPRRGASAAAQKRKLDAEPRDETALPAEVLLHVMKTLLASNKQCTLLYMLLASKSCLALGVPVLYRDIDFLPAPPYIHGKQLTEHLSAKALHAAASDALSTDKWSRTRSLAIPCYLPGDTRTQAVAAILRSCSALEKLTVEIEGPVAAEIRDAISGLASVRAFKLWLQQDPDYTSRRFFAEGPVLPPNAEYLFLGQAYSQERDYDMLEPANLSDSEADTILHAIGTAEKLKGWSLDATGIMYGIAERLADHRRAAAKLVGVLGIVDPEVFDPAFELPEFQPAYLSYSASTLPYGDADEMDPPLGRISKLEKLEMLLVENLRSAKLISFEPPKGMRALGLPLFEYSVGEEDLGKLKKLLSDWSRQGLRVIMWENRSPEGQEALEAADIWRIVPEWSRFI